jgi:hypothetical protein
MVDAVAAEQCECRAVGVLELSVVVADRDRFGERVEQRPAPLDPLC